jgi:interleukin-1 receptor-associated kinase 1
VRGIGSAIEYLHTGKQNPILHRDIKPSNVMLDDDFVAKLGDLGLVRQVDAGHSLGGTVMIGTRVYMDPICMSSNTVSTASDMYSFGVLLLEIATGLKPAEVQDPGGLLPLGIGKNTLVTAVRESYAKGEVLKMADERLNGDFDEGESEMERVLVVGLLCVQQQHRDRPEIRHAVNLLSDLSHPVAQILSQYIALFKLVFPMYNTAWGNM